MTAELAKRTWHELPRAFALGASQSPFSPLAVGRLALRVLKQRRLACVPRSHAALFASDDDKILFQPLHHEISNEYALARSWRAHARALRAASAARGHARCARDARCAHICCD